MNSNTQKDLKNIFVKTDNTIVNLLIIQIDFIIYFTY